VRGLRWIVIAGVVASLAAGCSGSNNLSTELSGGKGVFMGTAIPVDLKAAGYVEEEYAASGTATSYKVQGTQGFDGRWTFAPDTTAAYRTRVLVRRPKKESDFSGTVAVEWLNVSGGVDADPDWATLHEELVRRGDAWVGVSAQAIGVNGGPVAVTAPGGEGIAGVGLKKLDPARYGSLEHPGDAYSYSTRRSCARCATAKVWRT
jgi:hypothetical protein